jgi:hypothetical protein
LEESDEVKIKGDVEKFIVWEDKYQI